jgi:hypothetical protein
MIVISEKNRGSNAKLKSVDNDIAKEYRLFESTLSDTEPRLKKFDNKANEIRNANTRLKFKKLRTKTLNSDFDLIYNDAMKNIDNNTATLMMSLKTLRNNLWDAKKEIMISKVRSIAIW